ncbi:Superkiller viralicidic activity 2-like 2 [Strongyloides ratti]|uniref:Superkiller viralicidic activity 2-like 2 n=1 Tax=Strongyloides ratti TaxID=34506 RepID=A0A090L262_STRRB|nr:Superkiller viralicidic activity 2-like 2 [Strongyloides ratti]CEF61569.1 Superkiller viralicidic activity 2-like 2 [Strongyloides ratti]
MTILKHYLNAFWGDVGGNASRHMYINLILTEDELTDVGLMTGDVSTNVYASIVILTAEVLNEIIMNDSSNFSNVGYIIMDEGHFLGDESRGHVWEESIINMPKYVKLAILSATLQNRSEIAKWIVSLNRNPLHVIGTNERPITLEYCVHCSATGRIIQIKVGTDETDSEGLETAMSECQRKNRGKKELMELLKVLKDENMLPAIIYCPSKKTCDSMAKLISSMCFLDTVEKDLMNDLLRLTLFLEDEEMKTFMSEIEDYAVCLTNGIGVHHGSLMRMTKEFMEKCFINNAIKIMFSTETLAVGLNMPARTVIFSSVYKFDGNVRRTYKQSEFIQMAGRAGRRGIDTLGHVIFSLTDSNRCGEIIASFLKPMSENLESKYKIDYSKVLSYAEKNCLEKFEKNFEKSFMKFQKKDIKKEIAMYGRIKKFLQKGNFIDNEGKITKKGSYAVAARFNENYIVLAEMMNNNEFNFLNNMEIIEIFAMLQKDDEFGREEVSKRQIFTKDMVERYCQIFYKNERAFKVIDENEEYKSPLSFRYVIAMKEIYSGNSIEEVTSSNMLYKGEVLKRINSMRQIFENFAKNRFLDFNLRNKFFDMVQRLKDIEKNDVSSI